MLHMTKMTKNFAQNSPNLRKINEPKLSRQKAYDGSFSKRTFVKKNILRELILLSTITHWSEIPLYRLQGLTWKYL